MPEVCCSKWEVSYRHDCMGLMAQSPFTALYAACSRRRKMMGSRATRRGSHHTNLAWSVIGKRRETCDLWLWPASHFALWSAGEGGTRRVASRVVPRCCLLQGAVCAKRRNDIKPPSARPSTPVAQSARPGSLAEKRNRLQHDIRHTNIQAELPPRKRERNRTPLATAVKLFIHDDRDGRRDATGRPSASRGP